MSSECVQAELMQGSGAPTVKVSEACSSEKTDETGKGVEDCSNQVIQVK